MAYLVKQQAPDGAWRSDLYAAFKDGTALTPLVLWALLESGDQKPGTLAAVRKGSIYLAKMVKPDGTIDAGDAGLDYPVYTASLAVQVLSHPANKGHAAARDAWLRYLLDRQLSEKLGWKPTEKQFGGWGYCRVLPRKPDPDRFAPPLIESNLSATVFALDALRAAGVTDKPVYEKALLFVRRCQNWEPPVPGRPPAPHLDGGFFFIYDDPVRNKAGSADPPGQKPERFHSYGSTTADGLRALLLCPEFDPDRVAAAKGWLRQHARFDRHPGTYIPTHEPNRNAVYFYYAASAARAFRAAGVMVPGKDWAADLAAELVKRQTADGNWANPVELVRENEPLVATANAVAALARCRQTP